MSRRRIQTPKEKFAKDASVPVLVKRVKVVVEDCVRLCSTDNLPVETQEACIVRLDSILQNIHRAKTILPDKFQEELIPLIEQLREEIGKGPASTEASSGAETPSNRSPITAEQLKFLIFCGFTIPRMAEILGYSPSTVKRYLRKFNLKSKRDFAALTNDQLDELVKATINHNQRIGANAVKARLQTQNYKVQRWRVRESLERVDPAGVMLRSTVTATSRQTYKVHGPNSLWHVDGNHKLIRWGIAIHGGIDGYSRLLVFIKASTNNRKETVLKHFVGATLQYGLPSRIRVDKGGENNDISLLMEVMRGENRGSAIRGKSVHNQRIERVWCDVWKDVSNVFYDLFYFMETEGYLDITNERHLWALHYVFVPRINRELATFQGQWNCHSLRTEHHQSPLQLFVQRSMELANSNLTAIVDMLKPQEDGPSTSSMTDDDAEDTDANDHLEEWADSVGSSASDITCPLTEEALSRLQDSIIPLGTSNDIGVDLFRQVICFLEAEC